MKTTFLSVLRFVLSITMVIAVNRRSTAGEKPIRYLGIENGLSNNAVTCVTQDQYGFMWIGTYDGLNRYDGYEFRVYRNVWGDNRSLLNNHIKSICASGKRIYVGTEKGMMFFDYTDAKFHQLYYRNDKGANSKLIFNSNQMVSTRSGTVLVANSHGLIIFNAADTVGTVSAFSKKNTPYSVRALSVDSRDRVWAFVDGAGLALYDVATNRLKIVSNQLLSASCMAVDGSGNMWLGTDVGLYNFNLNSRRFTAFDHSSELTSANIYNLAITNEQELWILTNGSGINIWDLRKHTMAHLNAGEEKNSLRSGAVTDVYEDEEHRKWIATLRGGLNVIDDKPVSFKLYTHDPFNKNSVINKFILSFCEDERNNIWIGTDGGGLSYWNRQDGSYRHFTHTSKPGSLSGDFVVSIINDFNNQVWIATFNGGIDAFNKTTGTFKHYLYYKDGTKREEKHPWKLYQDSQHRIWASSTWGGALYLYNSVNDQFELFDARLTDIHSLFEDHNGTLWGGDYSNLIKIDTREKHHQYFYVGQAIRAMNEDKNHNFWLGTEGGGILLFDRGANHFTRFTEADGLPSNTILNILVDRHNTLWCSTYNGLSAFDPINKKIANYYGADGLQSNQFNYNAALKLHDGSLLFGGINGFTYFDPDSIASSGHRPKLMLTDFKIENTSISHNPKYALPIITLKEITIPFEEANLAVNYTALEYSFPEKIAYAYYLQGWDHGWNYVGKLKSAYYSRLNEGTYLLKIKATDTNGLWMTSPLVIKITILPPWYRTWWAYLLYISAVSSLVYSFWLFRIRQTRLRYEVEITNLKMEKEREVVEKKLSFFTNISHEFRTPLTLIINPIKDLIAQHKFPGEELNIVYRNARRLLGLVDHLLLFRKTESENADLKVSQINFPEICREVYTCFLHQAKIKHINYSFYSEDNDITVFADREKIEIALFNLISNALKFTPVNGQIQIIVKQEADSVYFEIADNGVGIAADVAERLFDKFYQVKDASSLKTGFGIGLYLVKVFIQLHNGTITYKSTSGEGTTFTLCLPKGLEHQRDVQLAEVPADRTTFGDELDVLEPLETTGQEQIANNLELMISAHQSILVIDDNDEIRAYIKKMFTDQYTIYEADNGEDGLEMIKKHLPDVVISDIFMPKLSGLELCQIIKKNTELSHIPIILLTGEPGADINLQGIEAGAVDFLSKPFDKELLIARVRGIIRDRKELQKYFFSEVTLKANSQNISDDDKKFLYKCIEIIENSLAGDSLEIGTIALKMGTSYSYLYKRIKTVTGQSMNGFIRFVRLRKAAELMIQTNCNVNEAAYRVGFSDIKYFRERFYQQFGLNPSEFIKRHRAAFQKSYQDV